MPSFKKTGLRDFAYHKPDTQLTKEQSKMKVIAIAKPGKKRAPEKIQSHVKEEARQAWEMYLKGIAREFYYPVDQRWQVPLCEMGELT
jgi:hypothetical protein